MIVLMKGLNEEYNVKRVISDFIDELFCEQIIVIDGGSTDYTVQELKKFPKTNVYVHPWLDWYHGMEVTQSNIALSYVPNGASLVILDFDEKFNLACKAMLNKISEEDDFEGLGNIARSTHDVIRYEDSPYAIIGKDGWPILANQIGQFPDYQPRIIRKTPNIHWINSPHHVLQGYTRQWNSSEEEFIIHYEKDDFRDRKRIERKWARVQATRKTLGLTADLFECNPPMDSIKYIDPKEWEE